MRMVTSHIPQGFPRGAADVGGFHGMRVPVCANNPPVFRC